MSLVKEDKESTVEDCEDSDFPFFFYGGVGHPTNSTCVGSSKSPANKLKVEPGPIYGPVGTCASKLVMPKV